MAVFLYLQTVITFILHSLHYNPIVTTQTNHCTQCYFNYNNTTRHQLLHVNTSRGNQLLLSLCTTRSATYSFIHSLVFSLEGRAWQEPQPSHVTGMALAHCILGKFLGLVCHCFPPPLDIPTLAARCLRPQRRERS